MTGTRYSNPIIPGFHPDPSWIRVGDTFYLVNSTFEYVPGLPIHASTDLASWTQIGHAITEAEPFFLDRVEDSGGIYAPTLRAIGGRYYIVCTSVGAGALRGRPGEDSFLITAAHPAGPWSSPVWVDGAFGIDPDLFEDEDGTVWYTGTRPSLQPQWDSQTDIWSRQIDLETGQLKGREFILWHGAQDKVVWSEGPHLYRRGPWYYLLTAEGGTERNHSVAIARSKSVTGPFEGSPKNPVLTHRHLGEKYPIQNVGHADMLEDQAGRWWAVMLGVRPVNGHHLLGRETFLCPLVWEDDWPVFAAGKGRVPASGSTGLPSMSGSEPRRRDGGDDVTARDVTPSELTPRGELRGYAGFAYDFRALRVDAHRWGISAWVRAEATQNNAMGLMIVQNSRTWARMEVSDRQLRVATASASRGEQGIHCMDVDGDQLRIAAVLNGLELTFSFTTANDDSWTIVAIIDATFLSTESAGGFVGCLGGAYSRSASAAPPQLTLLSGTGA